MRRRKTKETDGSPETAPRSVWRRRIRWGVALLVLVVAAVAGLLLTPWVPSAAVKYAAGRLGARVEIEGFRLGLDGFRAGAIRLYDGDAPEDDPPLVRVEGLRSDLAWFPNDGRYLRTVRMESASVRIRGRDSENTNFDFLRRLLERPRDPEAEPDLAFVPVSVSIGSIDVDTALPGMALRVDGLEANARVAGAEAFRVDVAGEKVEGAWKLDEYGKAGTFAEGDIAFRLTREGDTFRVEPIRARLEGFADISGTVTVNGDGDERSVRASFPAFEVNGLDLSQADWPFLPFPVKFAQMDLSGTEIEALWRDGQWQVPRPRVEARFDALNLGRAGHEWYQGDLEVSAAGADGRYTLEAVLGEGQRVSAEGTGTPDRAEFTVTFEAPTSEQVQGLVPRDYRPLVEMRSWLAGVDGRAEIAWDRPRYEIDARIEPRVAAGEETETAEVTAQGRGAFEEGETLFAGTVRASYAEGSIDAEVEAMSASNYRVRARLEDVALGRWLPLAGDLPVPETLLGVASGTVDATGGDPYRAEARLRLARLGPARDIDAEVKATVGGPEYEQPWAVTGAVSFGEGDGRALYGVHLGEEEGALDAVVKMEKLDAATLLALFSGSDFLEDGGSKLTGQVTVKYGPSGGKGEVEATAAPTPLPRVFLPADAGLTVKGEFRVAPEFASLSGDRLAIGVGDEGQFSVGDWSFDTKKTAFRGTLEGRIPAARLAPLNAIGPFEGVLQASGPVTYADGRVTSTFAVEADEFGWGDLSAPPGVPLTARGTVTYDVAAASGRIQGLEATWTEGTRMSFEPLAFTTAPSVADTAFSLETDLSPLVFLGLVDEAEGSGHATGRFRYDARPEIEARFRIAAPTLALRNGLAVLGGFSAFGTARYTDGFAGEGRFGAARAAAAGATVTHAVGPWRLQDDVLGTTGATATLWSGTVSFDADVGVFDEDLPATLRASATDLDLAEFTREYKPSETRLTGKVNGSVGLEWATAGFQDLEVDLKADRGFSVNRDRVYQLLMSEHVQGVTGGRRLDRYVQRALGDADQVPFDSGSLRLGMGEERMEGQGLLLSKDIKLTIDLTMTPESLADILRLRQEANIGDIDKITAEPLQLGE